jgi:hypothetical protein
MHCGYIDGYIDAQIRALDETSLAPIAREVLGSTSLEVVDWRYDAIGGSLGLATRGLYGIGGSARTRDGQLVEWSAVLKVLHPPAGTRHDLHAREPSHWAYWEREPLAYQSGLLDDLPGGLSAPRCLLAEHKGGGVWLWLEDLADVIGPVWPTSRYALAARHLGGFNGAYLSDRPLPDYPWLSHDYLRRRVVQVERGGGLVLFEREATWRHRLVRGALAPDSAARLSRLWAIRRELLDALDRLPHTLRHGDAHRENLIARKGVAGGDTTAAVDWAHLGIGPVGSELLDLALDAAVHPPGDSWAAASLGEGLFEGYASGLWDGGWRRDLRQARFGFAASTALAGAQRLHWTLGMLLDDGNRAAFEDTSGRSAPEILQGWGATAEYFLGLADEAEASLSSI